MTLSLFGQGEQGISHFALIMLGVIILIILYAFIGNFLEHKHFHYIHQTGVGIIIGFIFGLGVWAVKDITDYEFNEQIFFFGLLPPMIFAGGYNLKKSKFFENFTYISLYGVIGTVVTFGIIFGLTYLINWLGLIRGWENFDAKITLSVGLMIKYSATICASDSVAALTMIKPNKYPKLFSIVFGQGMINDAVAIILFKVVGGIFDHPIEDNVGIILLGIVGNFILNVAGSLLIGGSCALICSKVFQVSHFLSENPVAQVTIMYMFGILSYVLAEVSHMSGVITVLVCGICLAHFNFYNLSVTGQISTGVTFQTISFIAQAFVFIYLGISTMTYVTTSKFSYTFVLLQLAICAFARLATIFGLSYVVKLCMKKWNVSFYELLIISVAGVIRGSVAFALILTIGEEHPDDETKIVQSSVMLMVFITTITLGAIMPSFITGCLSRDKSQELDPLLSEQNRQKQKQKSKKQPTGFKKFDQEYLKPFFIRDYKIRKPQIKQFKKLLKLNSPQYKGGEYTGMLVANARQTIVESQLSQQRQKETIFTQDMN